MTQFSDLGLADPILKAVAEQGYTQPSPIQAQAIPAVIAGRDVMAAAQTGTGKTAGFTLPMLHRLMSGKRASANRIRALVLTPTRELAAQVGENVREYSRHLPLNCEVVFGGVGINPQMMALRKGVDILVACPGRLLDLYQQNAVRFDQVEFLVLDEADRMLDMGFIHDIKKVLALLPAKRQNLMFSATFSPEIRTLAKGLVNDPLEIDVSPRNSTTHLVEQWVVPSDKKQKARILATMLKDNGWKQVLVFTRTKHGANRLSAYLEEQGITSAPIHGNKSQGARTRALADFKSGTIATLVATDIAARGLDIEQLPHVVNFELPNVAADYVHRIGRTGRAGASGEAVSLVCLEEIDDLEAIEGLIGKNIERREMPGFAPVAQLPAPRPPKAPKKPKKAKAPKDHKDTFTREPKAEGARRPARKDGEFKARDGQNRSRSSEQPRSDKPRSDKPRSDRPDARRGDSRPASGEKSSPYGAARRNDGDSRRSNDGSARRNDGGNRAPRAPHKREHRRDGE